MTTKKESIRKNVGGEPISTGCDLGGLVVLVNSDRQPDTLVGSFV
jgi:hypothetical protein